MPAAKQALPQRPAAIPHKPAEAAAPTPSVANVPAPVPVAVPLYATSADRRIELDEDTETIVAPRAAQPTHPDMLAPPVTPLPSAEEDMDTIVALVQPAMPATPSSLPIAEDDAETIVALARPAVPPPAPLRVAEDDAETVVAQVRPAMPPTPPAIPAPARAPLPIVPAVEPAELFDEDYEPPTSGPVVHAHSTDHDAPRPAAGTPAPPSVIITHPPPSLAEEALAHAVSPIPEETHPALRSIRPPGTVQVSVGTLVIGALMIVVLVLGAVLLLMR
jgi:hypothetical protein